MIRKIQLKNLKFKTKAYAAIFIFFIAATFVRIVLVQASRGRQITSFTGEWKKFGKPVTVREIKKTNIPIYAKFTVSINKGKPASGFVTADIKDKLKAGQEIYLTDSGQPCGKITSISQNLNLDTGMYPVEVEFDQSVNMLEPTAIIFAQTQTLEGALAVPNNVLDVVKEDYYLWKVENKTTKKVKVKIGLRNGFGTIIEEGIKPADYVVFSGQAMLKENDKVDILGK